MSSEPERPRSEPEILPPERKRGAPPFGAGPQDAFQTFGAQRIFVGRVGPLGMILLVGAVLAILAIVLFLLAGFVMFVIPAIVLAALLGAALTWLRRRFGR